MNETAWHWSDLLRATRGEALVDSPPDAVRGISTDTRALEAGDLFVALRGEKFDGHDYLKEARRAGASAALVDELYAKRNPDLRILPLIVVEDTLRAYGALAHFHRGRCSASVVAVTGSVGKSSTRQMIGDVLRTQFRVHEAEKNYNNLIGTPRTILGITPETEIAVLENGIDRPGEMAQLASMSEPDVGVIVSIAPCHLERLGSLEGIAREKGLLLLAVRPDGWGVINLDSRYASYFQALVNRSIGYRIGRNTAVWADGLELDADARPRFTIHDRHGEWRCELSAYGRHYVSNALAAWCVGEIYEVSPENRLKALAEFHSSWGRLNRRSGLKGSTVLDDVYNANPASVRAALDTLRHSSAQRRIAVIGDMFDLGPRANELHFELGREFLDYGADLLVTLGPLAQNLAEGAIESGMPQDRVFRCESHEEVASRIAELIGEGDLVLVKASRGMAMEKVVERIVASETM